MTPTQLVREHVPGCDGNCGVHINWTRFTKQRRMIRYCPVENKRRRMVARFQDYYGWLIVCCGCGDQWEDGQRLPRPFARAWRNESVRKAKQLWDEIGNAA